MITYNSVNLIIENGSGIMANVSSETEMKECEIKFDDGRKIRFTGILLAEMDNSIRINVNKIEVEHTFWKKYKLYKTKSNKFALYYATFMHSNIQKEKYKDFVSKTGLIEYAIKRNDTLLFKLLTKAAISVIIEID